MRYPFSLPLVLAGTVIALAFLGAQAFGQDYAAPDAPPAPLQTPDVEPPPGVVEVPLPIACRPAAFAGTWRGMLAEQYLEAPLVSGLVDGLGVVEFWGSGAGTWTVVLTLPDGTSCLVISGTELDLRPGERS